MVIIMRIFPGDRIDLLGNSSIGIFGLATETYALFPHNSKENVIAKAEEILDVPTIKTSLVNSQLLGIFAVGNSKTLLLPGLVSNDEFLRISKNLPEEVQVSIIESRISALGNTIVLTDRVALVSPDFTRSELKTLENHAQVEVIPSTLMGNNIVGSLLFVSKHGYLAHPSIPEEELDNLSEILGIEGNYTTVNRGTPYPRPGIIGNSSGVLVGSDTTGPEMMRIYQVLSSN